MNKDLTVGTPWKVIAKFSLPVIGGNLFQLFYTMADTIIVGKALGADALAAVGVTTTVVNFELCFIQGFTGGFGILLGQAFGEKSQSKMKDSVSASWILSIIFSILLTAVLCLLANPILQKLNTPLDIYERAYDYLFIMFLGTSATVFYNMISNMLRALGDSRMPLYFLIFSSVLNVVLDIIFIVPLGLDVAGAALATVIAQFVSAFLCMVFAGKKFEVLRIKRDIWKFKKDPIVRHIKIGFPMGFQMSVMYIGVLAMQWAVNSVGTSAIAGYTAANKVEQISILINTAVSIGLANYVAQNFGARKWQRIRHGVTSCLIMISVLNMAMAVLILAGKGLVVPLFVSNPTAEIVKYSDIYLWVVAPFYIILGELVVYRTAIQSMDNSWGPFGACIIELIARISCAIFAATYFGYTAVCFSTPFAWITATIWLVVVYFAVEYRKLKKYEEKERVNE